MCGFSSSAGIYFEQQPKKPGENRAFYLKGGGNVAKKPEKNTEEVRNEEREQFNAAAAMPKPIKLSTGKTIYLKPPSIGVMRYVSEQAHKSDRMFFNPEFAEEFKKAKDKQDLANLLPLVSKNFVDQMFASYDLVPELIQIIVDGAKPGAAKEHALSIKEITDELNVFDIKAIVQEYRRMCDVSNFTQITKMMT